MVEKVLRAYRFVDEPEEITLIVKDLMDGVPDEVHTKEFFKAVSELKEALNERG